MIVVRAEPGWIGPPPRPDERVAEILRNVRNGGDDAVLRYTEEFDHAELAPEQLRVDPREVEAQVGVLEPSVRAGLQTAIANVKAVAEAQLREAVPVELAEGQLVEVADVPVGRAGVYAPGGQAAYASTVVMCAAVSYTHLTLPTTPYV